MLLSCRPKTYFCFQVLFRKHLYIILLLYIVEMSKYRGDQTAHHTLSQIQKILSLDVDEEEYNQRLHQSLSLSYSFLMQKKLQWTIELENLAKSFIDLAFQTNTHSFIKEVLKSYRSITQNQHPQSLKGVLEYYRDKKLQQILDDEISSNHLELIRKMPDIETDEASSAVIFSSFQFSNKNEREQIRNKLKIVWDGYKAIIDTVRVNQKLQVVYRNTLTKVFEFVDHYNRKHEFKSLCRYLREGLKIAINKRDKTEQQKGFYIDIEKEQVNTNNIQIRLEQFKVTTKLGLWQEAFQILQDINQIIKVRKGTLKTHIRSNYFENLSILFKKSNYWHYHAYAYYNYYISYINKPKITVQEKRNIADKLTLSILCIPPSTLQSNQNKESHDKICSMMMTTKMPEKKQLQEMMISRGVIENASQEIKSLWYFMFLQFDMTSLQKGLNLLKDINKLHSEFITLLEDILIYKQLISIAQVYQRIKHDHLLSLIPLPKDKIQKILLDCYHQKIIEFILDEKEGIVIFQDKSEDINPYSQVYDTFIDLAICQEEKRVLESNRILDESMTFMKEADQYYWSIRSGLIQKYKQDLKKPKQAVINQRRRKKKEEKDKRIKSEQKKRQKEEELKRQAKEKEKVFVKKNVLIQDIINIKQQRIVRVTTAKGEKKKIQNLNRDEVEEIELSVFQMLETETKNRVASDNENRFKKKFNQIHYFQRQRREILQPLIKEKAVQDQKNKKQLIFQKSIEDFEENQKLKNKISQFAPEVKDKINEHYNRSKEDFINKMKRYKEQLSDAYRYRIIKRAEQLREEERLKKIQEEKRFRQAEETLASENWTFRNVIRNSEPQKNDSWQRKADPKREERKEEPKGFIQLGTKVQQNRFDELKQEDEEEDTKNEKKQRKQQGKWNMKNKNEKQQKKEPQKQKKEEWGRKNVQEKKDNETWIKKGQKKPEENKNKFVPPPSSDKKEDKKEEPKKKGIKW